MKKIIFIMTVFFATTAWAFSSPDSTLTPGYLCSAKDPNFHGYDFPEQIARCDRNVDFEEKQEVAKNYGNIPRSKWSNYEFDHLIPLCAGGSNDIRNIWPQPLIEARQKDVLENDVCMAMKAGTMKQAKAVQKIHEWFSDRMTQLALRRYNWDESPRYLCETTGKTTIAFTVEDSDQISNAVVKLIEADGEHEVIRFKDTITGRKVKHRSELLKDHLRFVLHAPGSRDRFEIFLPLDFSENEEFSGYFKFAFDHNYPSLQSMDCKLSKS